MSFLFGGTPPTVSEMSRKYKMEINRQIRELERETIKLQQEEKRLFADLKRFVTSNPKVALQKAKSVVRVRRITSRFATMQGNLQSVCAKISSIKSMDALNKSMTEVSALMTRFNEAPALRNMHQTMAQFSRENGMMMAKSELMDESLNEVFDESEEDESDDVIGDIFTEAGVILPDSVQAMQQFEERLTQLRVPTAQFSSAPM